MAKYSILVVEDDKILLELEKTLLELTPYSFKAVSSAEDAIDMTANNSFKVFIIDINLGSGMHGVDLAVIIRKKFPNSKIYAITGYNGIFDEIGPAVAGFDAYFYKPAGFTDIVKRITNDLKP